MKGNGASDGKRKGACDGGPRRKSRPPPRSPSESGGEESDGVEFVLSVSRGENGRAVVDLGLPPLEEVVDLVSDGESGAELEGEARESERSSRATSPKQPARLDSTIELNSTVELSSDSDEGVASDETESVDETVESSSDSDDEIIVESVEEKGQ